MAELVSANAPASAAEDDATLTIVLAVVVPLAVVTLLPLAVVAVMRRKKQLSEKQEAKDLEGSTSTTKKGGLDGATKEVGSEAI